jgi:hypothetical protein
MNKRNNSDEESKIPQALLETMQAIIKNEQTRDEVVTSTPAYQRLRAKFIASVRDKQRNVIPRLPFVQLRDLLSALRPDKE